MMRAAVVWALPILLVAAPVCWGAVSAAMTPADVSGRLPLAELARGWWGTAAWSLPVALASCIVGWAPGRVLRARIEAGKGSLVAFAVVWSALVPPYALFYCAWRLCRPGTWIADWAATHGHVGTARACVLAFALVSWMWPVAALCVAALAPHPRRDLEEVASLDPSASLDRLRAAWRRDWRALVAATVVMCLALIGETTAFDVARVQTAASELRLLDAAGVGAATLWSVASVPAAVALCMVAVACAAWPRLAARQDAPAELTHERLGAMSRGAAHPAGAWLVALLVGGAVVVPCALMATHGMSSGAWVAFKALHGAAALGSLASAGIGGVLGGAVAAVTCVASLQRAGIAGLLGSGAIWAVGAAFPGVLLATAYESMWNGAPALRPVYDSALIVPLAQVAHAGFACWTLGWLIASRIPRDAIDAERVHGRGFRDSMRAHAPSVWASAIGGCAITSAYCACETAIASRLTPPGAERIAPILMSAIHYQDQSAALAALPWMGALAGLMAMIAVASWTRVLRRSRLRAVPSWALVLMAALCAIAPAACDSRDEGAEATRGQLESAEGEGPRIDPRDRGGAGFAAMASDVTVSDDAPPPLACMQVFGMRGRMPGRFDYPRAADVAPDGSVAVIDKSGRVQRFSADGTFQTGWRMPRTDNGMPTGVTVDRHGRLWIADTHEHRVLLMSPEGAELGSFGGYGKEPGQFIYPTDALMLDDSDPSRCTVVVSEYGGNDRLQWFDVTIGPSGASASPIRAFGSQGPGTGQFLRPQSMSQMPDGSIAVADACNHRVVMLSPDGEWRGTIGRPGKDLGELAYPYGVLADRDGTMLVAEFGNNRIQRIDAQGRGVWVRGGGGRDTGRLVAPWAIVGDPSDPLVVDAGNCRVVRVSLPDEVKR